MNFIFWAMASHGQGISGGDRIYIEFARRWSKVYPIVIITWKEGIDMMKRGGLNSNNNVKYVHLSIPSLSFFFSYLVRILISIYKSLVLEIPNPKNTYIYSVSEFWMDSIPCFILKLRYSKITWVASWYQTAPSPLVGFKTGYREKSYRLNALLLWLVQFPIKIIIRYFANYILVNNEQEKLVFPNSQTIVVLGAVNTESINKWMRNNKPSQKKFAAVFQGRFHPQKGVIELVDIWQKVTKKIPSAKLVMIGDGPLMPEVKKKISAMHMTNNILLLGFVFDGQEKYEVFNESRIVVHPAFFDSGGMATAEAMAFGLPAVGFDLPSYKSYYPTGMVKVSVGDIDAFSRAVIQLLEDSKQCQKLGTQAKNFIFKSYSWEQRSSQILTSLTAKS